MKLFHKKKILKACFQRICNKYIGYLKFIRPINEKIAHQAIEDYQNMYCLVLYKSFLVYVEKHLLVFPLFENVSPFQV